ncbi:MAG: hypothetical protein QXP81_04355 [Nitrososphaerota archaeon]|nr:hypothetical protein [Candidatus Calditenuis fumarioli]
MGEDLRELIRREMVRSETLTEDDIKFFKRFIQLTEDGTVILTVDRSLVTQTELILLYLVGRKLAHIAGLVDSPAARLRDIAEALSLPATTVSPRLANCVRYGEIKRGAAGYEIAIGGILSLKQRLQRLVEQPHGGGVSV